MNKRSWNRLFHWRCLIASSRRTRRSEFLRRIVFMRNRYKNITRNKIPREWPHTLKATITRYTSRGTFYKKVALQTEGNYESEALPN